MNMQYRQGDILFVRTEAQPGGKPSPRDTRNRLIIAEGEVTGHAHAVHETNVKLYRDEVLDRAWVVAGEPAQVVHEEHDTITLDPGIWQVVYQRQYVRGEIRRVLD